MPELVVGVDLGTGSARAVAVDGEGQVRGHASSPYGGATGWPPGRAEADDFVAALVAALVELGRSTPDAARPAALAVGGQSPTTVAVAGGLAVTVRHPAGSTGSPVEQHVAQHHLLRGEVGAGVQPLQLWDFALYRLGASVAQGRWPGDPPVPGFGEVVPTGTVVGMAHDRAGVAAGTPLVPAAQDAYLSFWAGGLDRPGRGLDPGGRTGGLGVAVSAGRRPADLYALPAAAEGVDIVGGPVNAHGLVLEWFAGLVGQPVADLLDQAASVTPGAGGVVALPYLEGERAPRWHRELRAELTGLGIETGPGHITRALLEATAYGLAHIAATLAERDIPIERLVVGGFPARSRLWCEIKAAVLGVPVDVPEFVDLSAYGAALAAGAAAGWWPSPGRGRAGDWPRPAMTTIDPVPCEEYRAGYGRFVALGDEAVRRLSPSPTEKPSQEEEHPCPTP